MRRVFPYGFPVFGSLLLAACMADHRADVTDVDPAAWGAQNPAEVRYINSDTVSLWVPGVLLRYERTLSACELPLCVETRSPDSLMTVDTVLFRIPPLSVRIAAQKDADFHETEQPFRSGVRLARTGEYRFRIVLLSEIRGITAAGIVLEPQNN